MANSSRYVENHQMTLKVGEDIDVEAFLNKLVNMGYRRESVVSHIGEFSLRGALSIYIH